MNRVLPLAFALLCCSPQHSLAGDNYLLRLENTLGQAGSNIAGLHKSAEKAAAEFVGGGSLWVAGRQKDFISEACGRAGGLMAIAPLGQRVPSNHDVILYAAPGRLDPGEMQTIARWQEGGAMVVQFNSAAGLYRERFPLDTVANVAELWTWTGEFVAACTRLGRMPVLYQTYGLPGGPERGKKYQGKKFHEDIAIKAIPAEVLGREYLGQVVSMLAKIREAQMPRILRAAGWWREAGTATTLVTGHMFPSHAQDPRAPSLANLAVVPAWEDKELLDPSHPPQFVLYLGYQFAPRKLVAQANVIGVKLVYTDVQPNEPAEPADKIIYIDPAWPLADACVTVPGYDIPILPASGVVQAAIYWTIASERAQPNSVHTK